MMKRIIKSLVVFPLVYPIVNCNYTAGNKKGLNFFFEKEEVREFKKNKKVKNQK